MKTNRLLIIMKPYLALTFFLVSLSSCSPSAPKTIYDYTDFIERTISFENLFSFGTERYHIYFYSPSCYYCNLIKQDVLSFISHSSESFYLLPYSKDIPIHLNANLTIGATTISEVWFVGTPSLIGIENGIVIVNIAGVSQIEDYLGFAIEKNNISN